MTRLTSTRVVCDDCGITRQGEPGKTIAELRRALAGVGWASDARRDTDVCPTCRERLRMAGR